MKFLMFILIPVVAMAMNFNIVDSAAVAKNFDKIKHLKKRVENVTEQMDQGIFNFKGQKPVEMRKPSPAPAPAPVLVHPDELFKKQPDQKIISYRYIDDGKYITKKDFNKIIDSLVIEFKYAFEISGKRSEELEKIVSELTDQSKRNYDRWKDIIDVIKGGSLAALLTSIAGVLTAFGYFFKKRKK